MRLGGLTPFMEFVREEMAHKCMGLLRSMYAGKKPMQGNRGVEEAIAMHVGKFAPARWGSAYIEIEKSVVECTYTVHCSFGGLLHSKRGERVRFAVSLSQNAITNGL